MIPGEILLDDAPVIINDGATILVLAVVNTGDRPVQVGSHYHFAEANPALQFDRDAARGHRLAICAGTSVRFEAGIERSVELLPLTGRRYVAGLRGEVAGFLDGEPGELADADGSVAPVGDPLDSDGPEGVGC